MGRSNWCSWWFGRVSAVRHGRSDRRAQGRTETDDSYCGAPYFSSMGALRFGADLAHVICEPSAGAAIKT
jgi:hypothetical protein